VCLVDTRNWAEPRPPYIALSHCWGTPTGPGGTIPLKTTLNNLESHQKGILLRELPKTFRDAVDIARHLGQDYLWIDSLAIIQDSTEDWQSESAQMASIYENALLTIAATTSTNCEGGCGIEPWHQAITKGKAIVVNDRWGITAGKYEVKLKRTGGNWRGLEGWSLPLHTRGWVLQEAVLSRRTLHMPFRQMVWQCREHLDYEDAYFFLPHQTRTTKQLAEVGFLSYHSDQSVSNLGRYKHTWWDLAENYSRRALTYKSDKLPAIAGVLRFYEKHFSDAPLLGLWKKSLAMDLSWNPEFLPDEQMLTSRVPGIPSWTWLCCQGEIAKPLELVPNGESELALVAWDPQWTGQPDVSPLKTGTLTVKSRIFKFTLDQYISGSDSIRETFQQNLMPLFLHDYGFFFFYRNDLKQDFNKGCEVTVLLLFTYKSYSEEEQSDDQISFLALLPAPGDPSVYVRTGYGKATRAWGYDSSFVNHVSKNWKEATVRLV
jgi:Heterokaryon incompatibility protein (HET)